MTVPNEVLTIWLPVAVTALLAILGLLRGVRRELVVAAAITLGALIVQQWAAIWAGGIKDAFIGTDLGSAQFSLGLLVIGTVTLFVGYMLGGSLADRPTSAGTRLLGGVLGALNGAALAGWVLRYAYVSLDSSQPSSPIYQNSISQGFMIWAGWFPVALALLGTLYALLSPLRRARAAVERPSAASDWTPTPPPTTSDTHTLPVSTGAATVALPVSAVSATRLDAQTDVQVATEPVPIWDRPRAAIPEERVAEPASLQSGSSASSPEASWLGGQEPVSGATAAPGTTAPPISDSNEDLSPLSSSEASGEESVCSNCGLAMLPGATFCTNCGTRAG
ncbi:MAG: CvpA family protein [Chloroflexia bacterium]